MSKIAYYDGYTLSQLRELVACGLGGYNTASNIRSLFAGYASTGNMAFATYSWIDSRCWTLNVYDGSGYVAVTSPWNSGYTSSHYPPQSYAVTSNNNPWVTIDAYGDTGYTFSYWMRTDPFEVWSYNANISYYVPTAGWEGTYRIGAAFGYSAPPSNCNSYTLYAYEYYSGIDCIGNYMYDYNYAQTDMCLQRLDYGGYQNGGICDPNCLVKGTTVEMADGTTKLIEKIRVGDILKGMKISDAPDDDTIIGWSTTDLNLTENPVRVTGIVPVLSKGIYNFNNGLLESTGDHAHFIKREDTWLFKKAKEVLVGDFLVDKQGNSIEITSITTTEGDERKIVYDMNVETEDTFIANGLITHNRPIKEIQ